ncbi:MAG: hypothetical protein A3G33_09760 [Omnitrophica bacterium RIFCSPLOWO2_12_FULL_44_17]|uniref:Transaldolase n=1 Tax=Candidatus Danuiimicrobium aquiferis TaxID=1801832 RepID=A0A1G1KX71_9BACT|nr:MAG: hypothetical protein A3B72_09600 [Omnitrophica bacterium RIFCSPHIGHO2_02_FULL_45_28]OGW89331.1 MAG: hypothetical protein A3E74_08610 [Omnitrophica bacterium RIFCSPHIGHO2_12_FULL_44_12]OGW97465.1 MAG: hypothetical protein A3G33_09760 [Omnitrophica bacterium RIFCSPLOWO2_12_FULL_44_17]OGX04923.1 MAG: hypothetical protein A3J12_06535 [Omnitrophica bacterium RIFCSPLOWO2_02_FULL_44_11]
MKVNISNEIAKVDLANLPSSSVARLYNPETRSNSFALDGFPKINVGAIHELPLPISWHERLIEIIEDWGALDMTTNQTLLRQLVESGAMDERIRELAKNLGGGNVGAIHELPLRIYSALYTQAAHEAGVIFSEVHSEWPAEGRVSQEASALITTLEILAKAAKEIHQQFSVSGFSEILGSYTKIPNLGGNVGPRAVEEATRAGVHVNVTLVFGIQHYLDAAQGYIRGLSKRVEDLRKEGKNDADIRNDLGQIYSVNSLFVSRIDRVMDPMIDQTAGAIHELPLQTLKGKTAVAQGKFIYRIFETVFLRKEFKDPEKILGKSATGQVGKLKKEFSKLRPIGANPQRLLMASTGVKADQPYHPLLYVLPFLGPWMHNTMPEDTLKIFSEWIQTLNDRKVAELKTRSIISEGLPEFEQAAANHQEWLDSVIGSGAERKITADQILREVIDSVLKPNQKTLDQICDELRDKGAEAFEVDEKATLDVIRNRMDGTV